MRNESEFERRGASRELLVLLHAYTRDPHSLRHVRRVVADGFPDADIFVPALATGLSSMRGPNEIVRELLLKLDELWAEVADHRDGKGYERIVLIGHSLGSLIARKLYVCACGVGDGELGNSALFGPGPESNEARPWAEKVERIVLLAGMNRGWRISHQLSPVNAILWRMGTVWGNVLSLVWRKPPLIFSVRRGAPFITQLRIQWIQMRNRARETRDPGGYSTLGSALTIQLLGSIDDMVSPEDNVDLISGRDFVYLDVPYSGHRNVIEMDDPSPLPVRVASGPEEGCETIGQARAGVLRMALVETEQDLLRRTVVPSDLAPVQENRAVGDVIFVIHGIRDLGYWTHKVARRALALARMGTGGGVIIATETSTYGYFPMLSFLIPTKRLEKVEWLMDQYAEAMARYPNAEMSFIGHSNGTYLLARALRDYPSCRFKNVVFAGSVVRTNYDWDTAIAEGRVQKVLNYVATADWVVALFPRALQMLHLQDLGSAGHDGFDNSRTNPAVMQKEFVRGGHGAALNEVNWDAIARFVLFGESQDIPLSIRSTRQSPLVRLPGLVAPLIWLLIALVIVLVFGTILGLPAPEWQRTLLGVGFSWLIWKVVTTV